MRGTTHPLHPDTRRALGERAQGDRAAQPARLVELPHLPLVREGLGVPAVRRRARAAPRAGRDRLPPLRPPRARCRSAATPAARWRSPATAPAPSGWRRSSTEALDVPVFRLDADTAGDQGRGADAAGALRRRARRAAARHADGGQGPRLPGRDARRRARRRLDAALPGLPRRGADVRADRPARGAGGARAARRARAGPDARRPTRRAIEAAVAARHAGLRGRRARRAARRCATRRSPT